MKANQWFYGSTGFGSSTTSQIPVIDPSELCFHGRHLSGYCPDCETEEIEQQVSEIMEDLADASIPSDPLYGQRMDSADLGEN